MSFLEIQTSKFKQVGTIAISAPVVAVLNSTTKNSDDGTITVTIKDQRVIMQI